MKKILLPTLCVLFLHGCGGGSGSSSVDRSSIDTSDNVFAEEPPKPVIKFLGESLSPDTVNNRSGMNEHEFDPDHTLSISWGVEVSMSDDSSVEEEEYGYTISIFLSDDQVLNVNDDTEIMSLSSA